MAGRWHGWSSVKLVKAGLAWHYTDYSQDQELARAEEVARAEGIGIWSLPNPIPRWKQQQIIDSGGQVIYHGKCFFSTSCWIGHRIPESEGGASIPDG